MRLCQSHAKAGWPDRLRAVSPRPLRYHQQLCRSRPPGGFCGSGLHRFAYVWPRCCRSRRLAAGAAAGRGRCVTRAGWQLITCWFCPRPSRGRLGRQAENCARQHFWCAPIGRPSPLIDRAPARCQQSGHQGADGAFLDGRTYAKLRTLGSSRLKQAYRVSCHHNRAIWLAGPFRQLPKSREKVKNFEQTESGTHGLKRFKFKPGGQPSIGFMGVIASSVSSTNQLAWFDSTESSDLGFDVSALEKQWPLGLGQAVAARGWAHIGRPGVCSWGSMRDQDWLHVSEGSIAHSLAPIYALSETDDPKTHQQLTWVGKTCCFPTFDLLFPVLGLLDGNKRSTNLLSGTHPGDEDWGIKRSSSCCVATDLIKGGGKCPSRSAFQWWEGVRARHLCTRLSLRLLPLRSVLRGLGYCNPVPGRRSQLPGSWSEFIAVNLKTRLTSTKNWRAEATKNRDSLAVQSQSDNPQREGSQGEFQSNGKSSEASKTAQAVILKKSQSDRFYSDLEDKLHYKVEKTGWPTKIPCPNIFRSNRHIAQCGWSSKWTRRPPRSANAPDLLCWTETHWHAIFGLFHGSRLRSSAKRLCRHEGTAASSRRSCFKKNQPKWRVNNQFRMELGPDGSIFAWGS